MHNLAVSKNVSFDLERINVFTISPNEEMSSPSAEEKHVVNEIGINRTPYRINFDSTSTETQDENENAVKHIECSAKSVNDSDDDDVSKLMPASRPRKNENA